MKNEVKLRVDSADHDFIQLLRALPLVKDNIEYCELPVGDFEFWAKPAGEEFRRMAIWERKDVHDFMSSVADGRFRTQRAKMLVERRTDPSLALIFLIEGDLGELANCRIPKFSELYLRNLLNDLGAKYNISTVFSDSLADTLRLVGRYENVYKEIGLPNQLQQQASPVRVVPVGRKKGLTVEEYYPCALSLIPGVTREAALVIAQLEYKSFDDLITCAYARNADIGETAEQARARAIDMFVGVEYDEGKKIGPAVSRRIYQYVLGLSEPVKVVKRARKAKRRGK